MKTSTAIRSRLFDESTSTTVEPSAYAENTVSMNEYRLLNPQTAEIPTLTQSRVLAAVLERQRIKALRQAERQARQQRLLRTAKAALLHPWQAFVSVFHLHPEPQVALARVNGKILARPQTSSTSTRVTSPYLTLPRA